VTAGLMLKRASVLAVTSLVLAFSPAVATTSASLDFYDSTRSQPYAVNFGFEGAPSALLFGSGDGGSPSTTPWWIDGLTDTTFIISSNLDDADFTSVVARLTDGIDELLTIRILQRTTSRCCFHTGAKKWYVLAFVETDNWIRTAFMKRS